MSARTIWKFPILSTGPMWITIPAPGTPVLVGRDPDTGLMALWAEVEPCGEQQERKFRVLGTGHDIPANAQHVGSAIFDPLVWHLFELPA